MTTRNTVIIVVSFGTLATVFVLFLIGINRATDPNPNREANLQQLAFMSRPEDVKPQYDANDTAIVTLKVNQKSGPVLFKEFTWFGEVKIDLLRTGFGETLVPVVLRSGDTTGSCEYREIRLLNMTADTATFRFVKGGYCPICWHMYRGDLEANTLGRGGS